MSTAPAPGVLQRAPFLVGCVGLGVSGTLGSAELLQMGQTLDHPESIVLLLWGVYTQGVRGNPLPSGFKSFLYVQK